MVSVRRPPRSSQLPPPPRCTATAEDPIPPHPAAGGSYHEQLVHLALAFNVGLVVGEHLKPETQSGARRPGFASSCGQAGLSPWAGAPRPAGKEVFARTHLSWYMSMLTTSLKQPGSRGEKNPLLIWSMACRSSGSRS